MTCISNQSTPKYVALSFAAIGVVYSIDDCLVFEGIQQLTHRPYPALEKIKRLARSSFGDDHKQGLQLFSVKNCLRKVVSDLRYLQKCGLQDQCCPT